MTERRSPKTVLIAYSMYSSYVQTTFDYLTMLGEHLGLDAKFVHVTNDAIIGFDINEFDVVINSYCARHCFENYVSKSFCDALKGYRGLKVMAVQDEYDHTNRLKVAIKELGFHIVLTCVPQSALGYVYPRDQFLDVDFLTVFTGYVSDPLIARGAHAKPLAERPIFIGYRGRDIGGRYGRLGFDKFEIGRRMKVECAARNIETDIAMDEDSRIYGTAWLDFIENCRCMLGTESGSNVFDFDGALDRKYKELTAAHDGRPVTYEMFEPYIVKLESEVSMGQISPRIFECAALRTPMVLYRGIYSNALMPDEHYIPLEKNFSNIESVLEQLRDLPALEALTTRAYDRLIASGEFSYNVFCNRVRQAINDRYAALPHPGSSIRRTIQSSDPSSQHIRTLAERPTDRPVADYTVRRFEIDSAFWGDEINRLDSVFLEALESYKKIISYQNKRNPALAGSEPATSARLRFESGLEALERARNEFSVEYARLRSESISKAASTDQRGLVDVMAQLVRLQQEWIPSYNRLYDACYWAFQDLMIATQSDRAASNGAGIKSIAALSNALPAWLRAPLARAWHRLPASSRHQIADRIRRLIRRS